MTDPYHELFLKKATIDPFELLKTNPNYPVEQLHRLIPNITQEELEIARDLLQVVSSKSKPNSFCCIERSVHALQLLEIIQSMQEIDNINFTAHLNRDLIKLIWLGCILMPFVHIPLASRTFYAEYKDKCISFIETNKEDKEINSEKECLEMSYYIDSTEELNCNGSIADLGQELMNNLRDKVEFVITPNNIVFIFLCTIRYSWLCVDTDVTKKWIKHTSINTEQSKISLLSYIGRVCSEWFSCITHFYIGFERFAYEIEKLMHTYLFE